MKKKIYIILVMGLIFLINSNITAQEPYRKGTTSANFLELGFGGAALGMGDSYVSMANDISSIYWNPAGLGYMTNNELMVMHQPWFADINSSFLGFGYVAPGLGTFGVGFTFISYGEEDVTSMISQEGTGEKFDGLDLAISISYGRKLADWFSFGASGKIITSRIWHESASAVAFDLGAIVNTDFLSWTGSKEDGLRIGMSITNYGTRMHFDGIDLKRPFDEAPDESGNFGNVPGRYETTEWELPLIFRIGISGYAIHTENHKLLLSVDALHPNNNAEFLNVGGEYLFNLAGVGKFALRGGYKGLFLDDTSEYGLSLGMGILVNYIGNNRVKFDYAYRDFQLLGIVHTYTVSFTF